MTLTVSIILFLAAAVCAGIAAFQARSLGWLAVCLLALGHLGL